MLGVALFSCYWTMLRPLNVQVNGRDVQVRVGTSAAEFIRDNDYFGAKAGRKLSIGGNVISEDGGTRYSVALDGKQKTPQDMEGVNVVDGSSFVVSDGTDVTEGSTEKTVPLAPAVQMESGGAVQFVSQWGRAGDIISCNVLWNIDTLDWKRPGADAIKAAVLNNAFSGAIVLMHDGGGNRQQDVEALPGIIDGLKAAGYELVTVSELLSHDDQFPKEVVEGTVTMPKDAQLPQV